MIKDLVTVKRSKRAKRIALRLDPVERVVNLIVPNKMSLKKAYFFAQEHEKWVVDTLQKLTPPIPFTDKTVIPIFGDSVMININHNPDIKRTTLKQYDDILLVKTYMDNPSNQITAHLRKLAYSGLANMANEKSEQINKTISSITVRDTKSRWGSCAQNGSLSFSWRLIFAPYDAIDYVVAHEIAHLVHMDHSKAFWALCRELSSDFVEGKYWMQNHGNELMCYGRIE